jgi:hypothetical protein
MENWWNDTNLSTQRKTSPIATLSTTNPRWTGLGLNLVLHGDRLVTDHLNHGKTFDYLSSNMEYKQQ